MNEPTEQPRSEKWIGDFCLALFAIGLVVGFLQFFFIPMRFGNGYEMIAIAKNLAEHGNYANPYAILNTGLTADNPPLYPIYLAVLMRIFPTPLWLFVAASLTNIIANACTAALLPRVSRLFFENSIPGVFGSILWLASMQLLPSWDTGFTVVGLLLFCLFSASMLGRGKKLVNAVSAGGLIGALFLLNPSSLLVFLPWIAFRMIYRKITLPQAVVLLATLFFFASVWAGRNYVQLGAFVVRTNLGVALYSGNNDCAKSSRYADELNNCYGTHHPNVSLSEAQLMRSMGEVKYENKRKADAMSWIHLHPKQFWILTAERFRDFWFPPLVENPIFGPVFWAITILSIPGLLWMIIRRESITLFVLTVLVLYPPMYYLVVSDVRYRYPVLWLSLLPAGYFLSQIYSRLCGRLTVRLKPQPAVHS